MIGRCGGQTHGVQDRHNQEQQPAVLATGAGRQASTEGADTISFWFRAGHLKRLHTWQTRSTFAAWLPLAVCLEVLNA